MGYKHADLLNYAKSSNLIIAKGDNVKNAKKFSDLTPTKQRIVRESYKKFISKKKKSAPKPAPKPAPAPKGKKQYTFTIYLPTDYSNFEALDYYDDKKSDFTYTEDFQLPKEIKTMYGRPLYTKNTYHRFVSKKTYGGIGEFRKAFPDAPKSYVSEFGSNYGYNGGIVKTLSK